MHKRFRLGFSLIAIAAIAGFVAATAATVDAVRPPTPFFTAESGVGLFAPDARRRQIAGHDEPESLPAPVSDTNVFDTDQSCLGPQEVLERLQTDRKLMGGKLVMLADGLQQSFSDAWRHKTHLASVRVSSVDAHLFSDDTGSEWNADVIEFDAKGCAMSRTLVPGEDWNALLKAAFAVQV